MAVNSIPLFKPVSSTDLTSIASLNQTNASENVNFGDMLKAAFNSIESMQSESAQLSNDFASGKIDNIQNVTIASQKAEIALQFSMQVRNKILDAYSEIMRMQI